MHFSQYYNAPMLLNPANTALMPDADYRVGANFRDQWSSLPVPYKTFSMYADGRALQSNQNDSRLGVGLAFFNDKAGDGELSLSRIEGCVAYHLALSETAMLSVGGSAAYVQRSVDFSKLSFDLQWDGQTFDHSQPNGELPGIKKTSYADVGAGLNLALYPNDGFYIKFGASAAHLNQPSETFYGKTNPLGIRPTGNIDALIRLNPKLILNPSVYYTRQKGAEELVYGTMFVTNLSGSKDVNNSLILGVYHRWNDAVIAAVGVEFSGLRVMATYDVTISGLSPYNNRNGAFEIGLRWQGSYPNSDGIPRKIYSCPRF